MGKLQIHPKKQMYDLHVSIAPQACSCKHPAWNSSHCSCMQPEACAVSYNLPDRGLCCSIRVGCFDEHVRSTSCTNGMRLIAASTENTYCACSSCVFTHLLPIQTSSASTIVLQVENQLARLVQALNDTSDKTDPFCLFHRCITEAFPKVVHARCERARSGSFTRSESLLQQVLEFQNSARLL